MRLLRTSGAIYLSSVSLLLGYNGPFLLSPQFGKTSVELYPTFSRQGRRQMSQSPLNWFNEKVLK